MAGITYPRVRVCYGQLTAVEVNVGSNYGTIILPDERVVANTMTITTTSSATNEYLVINGLTFTSKAAESLANRQFDNDAGDTATAASIAACINSALYGVPEITATSATNVVTLTWPRLRAAPSVVSSAGTMVISAATVTAKATPGGRQIKVVDAWIRTLGGTTAGCSAIELQTTAATPIVVVSWPVANIARDVVARVGVSNTVSTNVGLANAPGVGLKLAAITDMSGATAVDYCIYYVIGKGNTAS